MKPVCAIVGIGPGNGAALARRFDQASYSIALLHGAPSLLRSFATRAYACDVADLDSVGKTFAEIRRDLSDV